MMNLKIYRKLLVLFVLSVGLFFAASAKLNDADASILLGVTRDSVLQLAHDLGITVDIRPMTLSDIETADEMFFSGTAVEVTPIKEVDGRVIGDGRPGEVTRQLQATFFDAVHGRLPQYHRWLSWRDSDESRVAAD